MLHGKAAPVSLAEKIPHTAPETIPHTMDITVIRDSGDAKPLRINDDKSAVPKRLITPEMIEIRIADARPFLFAFFFAVCFLLFVLIHYLVFKI